MGAKYVGMSGSEVQYCSVWVMVILRSLRLSNEII